MSFSSYDEVIQWIYKRLPVYQNKGEKAINYKLENVSKFCEHLGNPQEKIKTIHIAGTNGKGSSSHMIASILQEANYRTGLYTSPHLTDFRERIKINGNDISKKEIINFINVYKSYISTHNLSFFELTVAMSFHFFADKSVDIAIIETGLGGRLDATNIITPICSLITNIGYDHTNFLGDTLDKIAYEKAGIIKENTPIVISEYQKAIFYIFQKISKEKNAPLLVASEREENYSNEIELKGNYQSKNLKGVLGVIDTIKHQFNIRDIHIKKGLQKITANTKLKGRWQIINNYPKIVLDTAHNIAAFKYIVKQLNTEQIDELYMLLGFVKGKDIESILKLLPKEINILFCELSIDRGLSIEFIKKNITINTLKKFKKVSFYDDVQKAYKSAITKANKNDFIYIGGSTFTVADFLSYQKKV